MLLLAAGMSILIPAAGVRIPGLLAGMGPVAGSLATAIVLFLPSSFLLSAVSPLLVRLGTSGLEEVGRRSGGLNGANAVGAIAGTVFSGFVLIPAFPLSRILVVTALLIAVGALVVQSPATAK
jgi:hypothetical protein